MSVRTKCVRRAVVVGMFVALSASATARGDQAAPTPASARQETAAPREIVPLKVTVVISRYQGEKRTSNLPFTLHVNANDNDRATSLRMGSSVPVPSKSDGSFSYQNVGTNIDCSARELDGGRYRLSLTVSDTSVSASAGGVAPPTLPVFSSSNMVVLRDGQTLQYTTASDKVSGETVKVDVTLVVVK